MEWLINLYESVLRDRIEGDAGESNKGNKTPRHIGLNVMCCKQQDLQ